MRNALAFLVLLLTSVACVAFAAESPLTAPCYGLQSPPPLTDRFDATTRSYLEPAEQLHELIAGN